MPRKSKRGASKGAGSDPPPDPSTESASDSCPSPFKDRAENRFALLATIPESTDCDATLPDPIAPDTHDNCSGPSENRTVSPLVIPPSPLDVSVEKLPDEHVVICSSPNHAADIRKAGPTARALAIRELVGDIVSLRILRSGDLLIFCKTPEQAKRLLAQNAFMGYPANFRPPLPRGTAVFGVVSGIPLDTDHEALKTAFTAAGVTSFQRLRKRNADGTSTETSSFRLRFSKSLPTHLVIGYERVAIRPFVFPPLQCFACHRYGHEAKHCRSQPRCGRCGQNHPTSSCNEAQPTCPLCQQNHPAWDRACPFRLQAQSVQQVRAGSGISYAEAVKRVAKPPLSATPPSAPLRSTPDHGLRVASCPSRDVSASTACTLRCDASTQTELQTDFLDSSSQTSSVLVLSRPPECILLSDQETGNEQTAILPLSNLQKVILNSIQLLDSHRREQKNLTIRQLVQLVIKDFFSEDANEQFFFPSEDDDCDEDVDSS